MPGLNPIPTAGEPDFDDSDFDDFEDDYYDENGHVSPGGLFDVGGHAIPERWADFADAIRDRMKDER